MNTLRAIKLLLAGIVALFAVATVTTAAVIAERQEALRQTSRYNLSWLASQATTEFARLVERVSASAMTESGVDADEVQLRFDIVLNRLQLFGNGEFRQLADSDPESRAIIEEFVTAIPRLEPLVAALDSPGVPARLRAALAPFEGKLTRLAAAANRFGGEQAASDQAELLALHWAFSALAVGLIFCGVALMGLLAWHNVLLRRAHADVNRLADDLQGTSDQLNVAMNNMGQGLCMADRMQRLKICNARFLALFSLSPEAVRPGQPIGELFAASPDVGGAAHPLCATQAMLIADGQPGSYSEATRSGRILAVSHQPLPDGGWVATYEDITERRQAEARIAHLAHHDVLTDLPNRALFLQELDTALVRARRGGDTVAVLSLDLDRFKSVNDTLGHPVGDVLLCQVAERLKNCIRQGDVVARFGGDEFAVLQTGREQPRDADALASRIVQRLAAPYMLEGNEVVIGASVGISVAPNDGLDGDELLKNADMALYRAKAEGRGAHRFFEPAMDSQLRARRALEIDLRQALARNEFELHYQPLVNLGSDTIEGYEALLRWNHPVRGPVSPALFIPVAEEIGLIAGIGEWVIRRACEEAATWPAAIKVAINLSPVQFRGRGPVPVIVSALASSGLPAKRLELEITESVLLQDNDATLAILHQLRGLGTRIALDDFGTGFSSLSYLRSFPFDKIKIDQSFIRDSGRADCIAIVQAITSLARTLGMITTAEGIETVEQLDRVRAAGCTQGQGYLFARPRRCAELTHALAPAATPLLRVVNG